MLKLCIFTKYTKIIYLKNIMLTSVHREKLSLPPHKIRVAQFLLRFYSKKDLEKLILYTISCKVKAVDKLFLTFRAYL